MNSRVKRIFDLVLGTCVLLALSPILLGIAIAILVRDGRPVLFKHRRAGLHGKEFTMYKFRSMTVETDAPGTLLPLEERITALGKKLRDSSLDELPQIWNVLMGDMSLVGPRPLPMKYLGLYTSEQARRNEVLPGITGWAQVNGRNAITWKQKFELDVWYVDHRSFWLDLKIVGLTVLRILQRKGVRHGSHPTMPEFLGSPERNFRRSMQGNIAQVAGDEGREL
jgi:sugar transferase EpsL